MQDLADTKEKFAKLAEEIEWSDAESFKKKCETIKESYFGKKEEVKDKLDDVAKKMKLQTKTYLSYAKLYTAAIKTKLKTLSCQIVNTEKGENKMYLSETHEKNGLC